MSGMVVGFRLGLCGRRSEEGPMIPCTCDPAKKTCSIIMDGSQWTAWTYHNQQLADLSMMCMNSNE